MRDRHALKWKENDLAECYDNKRNDGCREQISKTAIDYETEIHQAVSNDRVPYQEYQWQ